MALFNVYSLTSNFPRELKYRGAVCRLEIAPGKVRDEWVLRAKKVVPSTFCDIAKSRYGRLALNTTLRNGFAVEVGSPAAKILDRLVAEGFASKRPASRRDQP